jgi:cell fate regulator YaaT (PSP1 superfamily)
MGCGSCSSGGASGVPNGCKSNGSCSSGGCNKLNVFDWLSGIEAPKKTDMVEVRFKNTRKEFYINSEGLALNPGDVIAVEASGKHDIGVVSMKGELVKVQMSKKRIDTPSAEIKKIYRIADQKDIDVWQEAQELEKTTMTQARVFAAQLKLNMKISDVEYQGDKSKATFYYTAEERVDFRELIRKMADKFKVKIEMRQIGARQEAGRLGGIGSCGRELCCSTWLTDFRSVSTNAARYQQLSLNPQKLAGQCGKLKCCLNFELDTYVDALKEFPKGNLNLKTKKGVARHQKTDIFMKTMWFTSADDPSNFVALHIDAVKEIIAMNKEGNLPEGLKSFQQTVEVEELPDFENVVGQDSLNRFDNKAKKKNKGNRNNKNKNTSKNKKFKNKKTDSN